MITAEAVVGVFSIAYWSYSQSHPHAFALASGSAIVLSKVDAVYFSLTAFTTTGFGDVHPLSDSARGLVTIELAVAFAFVSLGLTLLIGRIMPMIQQRDRTKRPQE